VGKVAWESTGGLAEVRRTSVTSVPTLSRHPIPQMALRLGFRSSWNVKGRALTPTYPLQGVTVSL
jgi:hypothetical protein